MKREYISWNPKPATMEMVAIAEAVIDDLRAQGFTLTLRQLYYQIVSRDLFPADRRWSWTGSKWIRDPEGTINAQPNYKWLGELMSRGRLAGLIDWWSMEDRGRQLTAWVGHTGPEDAIQEARDRFNLEKWERQPHYCEVWIEKDALSGVFSRICSELEVPFFACKGYTSLSAMWRASQRLIRKAQAGKEVTIFHFGDHDPSGIDMTRDIIDRLYDFHSSLEVRRIALNMDQVEEFDPPPNPAKMSDSRAEAYVDEYGYESWELDALDPSTLSDLVREQVDQLRDEDLWAEAVAEETEAKRTLQLITENYDAVAEYVEVFDLEEDEDE